MKKHIVDEQNGIPYTLVGNYYLPWGDLPDDEPEQEPIGIWGQRYLRHIKQHRKSLYYKLLTDGKLNSHLAEIDKEAEKMFNLLVNQIAEREGVTEQLKATNQMAWIGLMNNIRNAAMEIVNSNIIFI